MSRVLLTGAGGFLGAPTLQALRRAGHEVHAVSRTPPPERGTETAGTDADAAPVFWHSADLTDPTAVQSLVRDVRPQSLVHMAWYVEHGRYWHATENLVWVEATLRLLRCFVDAGGQRAVMAGTCAEYEWSLDRYREATAPLVPATLYGVAKDATRRVAERFADGTGIELAWGRIFTPYGPAEGSARLLASVIGALLAGQPAPAPLGTHVRDLMYVEDVAGAFAAILDSGVQGAVNVGSGQPTSIRELLAQAGEAVGRPELLQWGALPQREGEPAQLVADTARLRDEVGFESVVGLGEGIERTVAWWRERVS
ncbi:MAG: NAD-dependent epimerase/dehydratase family protein [Solirubrobacteraceae bacterium]